MRGGRREGGGVEGEKGGGGERRDRGKLSQKKTSRLQSDNRWLRVPTVGCEWHGQWGRDLGAVAL